MAGAPVIRCKPCNTCTCKVGVYKNLCGETNHFEKHLYVLNGSTAYIYISNYDLPSIPVDSAQRVAAIEVGVTASVITTV